MVETTETGSEGTEETGKEIVTDTGEIATEESVEYTPSYKYKVKDEEREFDKRLHAAIKTKEDEDYIRDLHTRADGLDTYKKKHSDLEGQTNKIVAGLQKLQQFRDSGDIGNLVKSLGLKDDALIDYVKSVLDEDNLPKEQKDYLERMRKLEDNNRRLE